MGRKIRGDDAMIRSDSLAVWEWAAVLSVIVSVFILALPSVGDRFTATDAAVQQTVMQMQIDALQDDLEDVIGGR